MSYLQDSRNTADFDGNIPHSSTDHWELAYLRFETPEDEIRKFVGRLKRLGVSSWPRDARILELFCGRGNGLHALQRLGFQRLKGVDISRRLLSHYRGPAKCHAQDCRVLQFATESEDAVIVQGGLHHLLSLPDDLEQTFAEIRRVLKSNGHALFVEPWLTPFLQFVHAVTQNGTMRRLSPKLDALATMIEHERATYENWLGRPEEIAALARKYFVPVHETFRWGKWNFVGLPRH
jgi:SAM-dependent methyltransferase